MSNPQLFQLILIDIFISRNHKQTSNAKVVLNSLILVYSFYSEDKATVTSGISTNGGSHLATWLMSEIECVI